MNLMPRHLRLSAFALAVAAFPAAAQSLRPEPANISTPSLCAPVHEAGRVYPTVMLELNGPRESVSFSSNAEFRILFIGIGRAARILENPSVFKDLFLNVQDENGASVTGKPLPGRVYHSFRPPLSAENLEFTEIGYGELVGVQFSMPVQEIVPGPGIYRARAIYESLVPQEFSDDPDVIAREDGKCVSEPIELVVTP